MTRTQAAAQYRILRSKSKTTAKDFDHACLNELSNNFERDPNTVYLPAQWVAVAAWILG